MWHTLMENISGRKCILAEYSISKESYTLSFGEPFEKVCMEFTRACDFSLF